ncbi:hypothetical protein A3742_12865 [Oleiphilus sp. HI0071]|nr:hypothetical protein A3737_16225 [Oleiphilus sp. HI0065]KZY79888.1 hypothetical protein A3742_21255 [Oleiphilus sp. HI0071]KZY96729.1 hypothetical protein A3744_32885 [Oleiphilus sp. HI0073]KZZ12645.1 hypothetical protein A3750_05175 [Oleiphilus sp. HI0079]KZZ14559.1 hypothetical protein A3751_18310 [Oleiphilus sp. HI0080]KZZ40446.1 hypothetical protein A3758_23915 [Oleiphilus sp. HI0118]KZZ51920.1 hypothetical protein A3760_11180 [Oleiphilus sp. HI0122]
MCASKRQQDSSRRNSEYYFSQLPEGLRNDLSTEQAREIKRVIDRAIPVPSKKIFSLELTFWLFKRFYCVFYLGEDKRRLIPNFGTNYGKMLKLSAHIVSTLIVWIATIFVAGAAVYYAKSTLGIDIFPNQHAQDIITETIREQAE